MCQEPNSVTLEEHWALLPLSHLSVLLSSLFNLIFLVHGDISSYHSHSPLSLVTRDRLSCIGSLQVSMQLLFLQCWDAAEASVHMCKPYLNPPPHPPYPHTISIEFLTLDVFALLDSFVFYWHWSFVWRSFGNILSQLWPMCFQPHLLLTTVILSYRIWSSISLM